MENSASTYSFRINDLRILEEVTQYVSAHFGTPYVVITHKYLDRIELIAPT